MKPTFSTLIASFKKLKSILKISRFSGLRVKVIVAPISRRA
jgi:hypothetical protein